MVYISIINCTLHYTISSSSYMFHGDLFFIENFSFLLGFEPTTYLLFLFLVFHRLNATEYNLQYYKLYNDVLIKWHIVQMFNNSF